MVQLYYSTSSCSAASFISAYMAGLKDVSCHQVDVPTHRVKDDGSDFYQINPKGNVPCLRLDDGTVLHENASVLSKLAEMKPEANLMPKDDTGRLLEQQALSFVASELHASLRYFFSLPKECSEETKSFLLAQAKAALDKMAHAMLNDGKSKWLVKDSFTVADAYAYVVLGWLKLPMINIDISQWPVLKEYRDRISNMDAVKAAELRMNENPKTVVA